MSLKLYVQRSQQIGGVLRLQSLDEEVVEFLKPLVDRYESLRFQFDYKTVHEWVTENNVEVVFPAPEDREEYERQVSLAVTPFTVNSPFTKANTFLPFQNYGMNLVVDDLRTQRGAHLQWGTGVGKTVAGTQVTQKMFEKDKIDLCILVCTRTKKPDWYDAYEQDTYLTVEQVEGERANRVKRYKESDAQVLVTNYEKLREDNKKKYDRTDILHVIEAIKNKRVLIICDEASRLGSISSTLTKGIARILKECKGAQLVTLTATPYSVSPLNLYQIMRLVAPDLSLSNDGKTTKGAFEDEYVKTWGMDPFTGYLVPKEWHRLGLLGKRILPCSSLALKSDPRIASQFPEKVEKLVHLEMSDEDRAVYKAVQKLLEEEVNESNQQSYVNQLRMLHCTMESCMGSDADLLSWVRENVQKKYLTTRQSLKYQKVLQLVTDILDEGEKVVLFTFWANAVLPFYLRDLQEDLGRDARFFVLKGGMKDDTIRQAIDGFNNYDGPCVFFSTDAGQEGLNLYAQNLINIEIPPTYKAYIQRRDRIDRVNSRSKGILSTNIFRFVTAGTVERADERRLNLRKKFNNTQADGDEALVVEDVDFFSLRSMMVGK